jgi:hypothetical protein
VISNLWISFSTRILSRGFRFIGWIEVSCDGRF